MTAGVENGPMIEEAARGPARADYHVLGVRISPLTREEWLSEVRAGVETRARRLLVSQNLHSAYLASRTPVLAEMQARADVVRIDGMPLVWVARMLGLPVERRHRAGFMDLMPLLMSSAASAGWKVMVIAGRPGVAETAAATLRSSHPGLLLVTEDGYFPLDDSDGGVSRRLERVRQEEPDVLLVGMGMPRQEEFLRLYLPQIGVPVVGTCGAAFDYVAGVIPMAPRWLSAVGLEWLFRLVAEPRRLWRRYLLEPMMLFPRLMSDLRHRRFGEAHFRAVRRDGSGDVG